MAEISKQDKRDENNTNMISGGFVAVDIEAPLLETEHKMENPTCHKGNNRRISRRRATWLGPRRLLFVFAALSSMGTLMLIYFTLSIAKRNGNEMNNL